MPHTHAYKVHMLLHFLPLYLIFAASLVPMYYVISRQPNAQQKGGKRGVAILGIITLVAALLTALLILR